MLMSEEQNQLFLMLGRLEGKVDAFLTKHERHEDRLSAVEDRVSTLEQYYAKGAGAFAAGKTLWVALAAVIGAFSTTITHWLKG